MFRTKTSENMAICAAATFACGLFSLSAEPLGTLYPFAAVVVLLVWAVASVSAGFLKQWFFPVFSAVFLLLPHLLIDAAQSPTRSESFTALNDVLALLGELIAEAAPRFFLERFGVGRLIFSEIYLGATLLLFLAGAIARRRARGSRFYCEARLNMLEGGGER
ncbi:MAG: hypothetical protein NC202_04315 [Roseburia sp.]|nr:hypothetical protein [Roseburia sp.]